MDRIAKKVLLIGWDAADWKFLTPLMEKGLMPNLQRLIEGGVKGKLATLDPPLSPTLWTSIATGKRPYKHGIHGFTEPTPDGKGIRPIYLTNRKVKAIWNILNQHGLKSNVIGWWPSHPSEPINGVMVSDFFQRSKEFSKTDWPIIEGAVHPSNLKDTIAQLRIHPTELTAAHIQPFVPDGWKIYDRKDPRLWQIAKITAECSSIQSIGTYVMDHFEWDFTAIYFDAIDHYCHGFMKYHPPRRPFIPQKDFELFKDVVKGGCIYHDMMLGRLLEQAGEDTTIVLISDHGFHPDHNRPVHIPKEPSGPAIEHSPYGVIVMKGPGIKEDELIFGANLLDITPTLLTLFGLPVAEDMDGKVLTQAFETIPTIDTIQSWENIKGQDGRHPTGFEVSEATSQAELQQLIELGYIKDPGEDLAKAVKETRDENNYYLARSYIDGHELDSGLQLLEQLYDENPDTLRYAIRLAHVYQMMGKFKQAREVVNHIRTQQNRESSNLDILEGSLLLAEQRPKKALDLFKKAASEAGHIPQINLRIAHGYLALNELDAAEEALQKELSINSEDANAWRILGQIHYNKMQYEKAIDAFLHSISLEYDMPSTHFALGESLVALEKYEEAIDAFEICLKLVPGFNTARQRLIAIYEQFLGQPGKAHKYKTDFENHIKGELVIVSGLPRSGTSMMMQMLEAGGMKIFTDHNRTSDINNQKGYYEHEAIKNTPQNKDWVIKAVNKGVKVIAHLLPHLPFNFRYKILFMERNLYEVVQSQQRMLHRQNKNTDPETLPLNLLDSYKTTIKKVKEWAKKQPNVDILYISHKEVLDNPFYQAMLINDFLDNRLLPETMATVVDHSLYREKLENTII